MASGTFLKDFADYGIATGPAQVRGPRNFVNDAVKRNYFWSRAASGNEKKKLMQGGSRIEAKAFYDTGSTFQEVKPGQQRTWSQPQVLRNLKTWWRFAEDHMAWYDQDIILNEKMSYGDEDMVFQQFVDEYEKLESRVYTSMHNGLEDQFWAQPNTVQMETEGGLSPYSVFALINEDANGLWGENFTGNTWTTVHEQSPTGTGINGKWAPQQLSYDSAANDNDGNVISIFDRMIMKVKFDTPRTHAQYWEDPRLNRQIIYTSLVGRAHYSQLLRQGQDHFVAGPQDPSYQNPQFSGIEIAYVEAMDDASIYDDGSNDVTTELLATNKGPRYIWHNGNYLYPVFHEQRFMERGELGTDYNAPDAHRIPIAIWWNLMNDSRQRQGHVRPSGSVITS